jgi:hypothetical protein
LGVCLGLLRYLEKGGIVQSGTDIHEDTGSELTPLEKGTLRNKLFQQLDSLEASPMEKLLLLNAWTYISIQGNFKGYPFQGTEDVLQKMTGSCGPRDILIRDIFSYLKFNNRQINFFNIPVLASHSATEISVNDYWYFVDGTLGLYFSNPDKQTVPLSIEEARQGYPNIHVMKVANQGWTGQWIDFSELLEQLRAGTLYQPYEEEVLYYPVVSETNPQKVAGEVERTYITSVLLPTSPEFTVSFPVALDFEREPNGQLGEVDASLQDLMGAFHTLSYGSVYDPYLYALGLLGAGGPVVEKEYVLVTTRPRSFNLTFSFLKAVPEREQKLFLKNIQHAVGDFSSGNTLLRTTWTDQSLTLQGKALPPFSRVRLYLSKEFATTHAFALDSIQWQTSPLSERVYHRVFE